METGVNYASNGTKINADESLTDKVSSTTPNKMYKAASKLPNAEVLKDPGVKVDQGFIEAVSNGKKEKARKKID